MDAAETVAPSSNQPVLEIKGLSKSFGPVRAVTEISLRVHAGEVLGLVGDNGAGKSTLVRCIGGIYRVDSGEISVDGVLQEGLDPEIARELGIEIVHQGLSLVEQFDVAQNMFLNRELIRRGPAARRLGWLDKRTMYARTASALSTLGIRIDPRARVATLSGGQRQIVAVARAVTWGRHIVVLDEPAAALGVRQAEMVLNFIRMLAGRGVAVVFISHNMEHVLQITDRVAVMRRGMKVADTRTQDVSAREIVAFITGADTHDR